MPTLFANTRWNWSHSHRTASWRLPASQWRACDESRGLRQDIAAYSVMRHQKPARKALVQPGLSVAVRRVRGLHAEIVERPACPHRLTQLGGRDGSPDTCRFRKLYPFDWPAVANQNMIAK